MNIIRCNGSEFKKNIIRMTDKKEKDKEGIEKVFDI